MTSNLIKGNCKTNSFQSTGLNEAVTLLGSFQPEFGHKKTEHLAISVKTFGNMPKIGLEPTHLAAPEPKSGVSTNFTTWADEEKL